MKIILVEDDDQKRKKILEVVEKARPKASITKADSVVSAIEIFKDNTFDLLILDMSLPTLNITLEEEGGRPQGFGGIELLRYLDRDDIAVPTIVVTAYDAFTRGDKQIGLEQLKGQLLEDHSTNFKEIFLYSSTFNKWAEDLFNYLKGINCENSNC